MNQAAWSERDIGFMQAALVEARTAAAAGEIPVGAVVVVGNKIIASAANNSLRAYDPGGQYGEQNSTGADTAALLNAAVAELFALEAK